MGSFLLLPSFCACFLWLKKTSSLTASLCSVAAVAAVVRRRPHRCALLQEIAFAFLNTAFVVTPRRTMQRSPASGVSQPVPPPPLPLRLAVPPPPPPLPLVHTGPCVVFMDWHGVVRSDDHRVHVGTCLGDRDADDLIEFHRLLKDKDPSACFVLLSYCWEKRQQNTLETIRNLGFNRFFDSLVFTRARVVADEEVPADAPEDFIFEPRPGGSSLGEIEFDGAKSRYISQWLKSHAFFPEITVEGERRVRQAFFVDDKLANLADCFREYARGEVVCVLFQAWRRRPRLRAEECEDRLFLEEAGELVHRHRRFRVQFANDVASLWVILMSALDADYE